MRRCVLLLLLLLPTGCATRCGGQYTACLNNLKNVGTALEMYSTDAAGRYPGKLAQLVPNYLKTIPTCSTAGRDTYSDNYAQVGTEYAVHCERRVHERQYPNAASPPAFDSVHRLHAWRDPAPHDLAACRDRLLVAGKALEDHLGRGGSRELIDLPLEVDLVYWDGHRLGTMVLLEDGPSHFRLACAGAVHVRDGLPPFTPFYDSHRGLVEALPEEGPREPELGWVLLGAGSLVVLLAGLRRRCPPRSPKATWIAPCMSRIPPAGSLRSSFEDRAHSDGCSAT